MIRRFLFLVAASLLTASVAVSELPRTDVVVPESLKPWVPWVLDSYQGLHCALQGAQKVCSWPGEARLSVGSHGGTFEYEVRVDADQSVVIPGGEKIWPLEVQAISHPSQSEVVSAVLQQHGGRPTVFLRRGFYTIRGQFHWDEMPESILLPNDVGLVGLVLDGKRFDSPNLSAQGELWLRKQTGKEEEVQEADRLGVQIFRELQDGVPFRTVSVIELRISGRSRDIQLGQLIPDGEIPVSISSKLRYSLDENQKFTVQAKPGVYRIEIESVRRVPPESVSPSILTEPSWVDEEYWAWAANTDFRSVEISGASPVDAKHTPVPEAWNNYPIYVVKRGNELHFKEVRRGQQDVLPNALHLRREMWLNIDGKDWTIRDNFSGSMSQGWRLNADGELNLGRVLDHGDDQLISEDQESKLRGVELRSQDVSVVAESVEPRASAGQLAIGWDLNVDTLETQLHLPPGWRFFHATGVNETGAGWVASWQLYDLFLVILVALATAKLYHRRWGLVALLSLVLSHGHYDAPYQVWFHLLGCVAVLRVVPEGTFRTLVKSYFVICLGVLILVMVSFVIRHVRGALYPQLQPEFSYFPEARSYSDQFERSDSAYQAQSLQANQLAETKSYSSREVSAAPSAMVAGKVAGGTGKVARVADIDPNAVVQTGPGIPRWNGQTVYLNWSGPVRKDQNIKIFLLSPRVNFILAFTRVMLLLLFSGLFFLRGKEHAGILRWFFGVMAVTLCFASSVSAQEFPSQEMLDTLGKRLTELRCTRDCTTASEVAITLSDEQLSIAATVSSSGDGAWPIPGPVNQYLPDAVAIDGKPTKELRRETSGILWVRVPEGTHRIGVSGQIFHRNVVTLHFALNPGHVSVEAPNWLIDGISSTGSVDRSIQLTREQQAKGGEKEKEAENVEVMLPNFYEVHRTFTLGIHWEIVSVVNRVGSTDRPAVIRIPLLAGESVTSSDVKVEGNEIILNFPRGVQELSWESNFQQQDQFSLQASSEAYTENWSLTCGALWRCRFEGVAPIASIENGRQVMQYEPWPGETLTVGVTRPVAAPGVHRTLENVEITYRPGEQILQGEADFLVRTSEADWMKLELPEGAEPTSLLRNSQTEYLNRDGRLLSLPVAKGSQSFVVKWEQPWSNAIYQPYPVVNFFEPAVNIDVNLEIPKQRWILALRGPTWGPAILFWGELVAIGLLAFVLGRSKLTPLRFRDWALLGIGLRSLSVEIMLVPVGWLLALGARAKHQAKGKLLFNTLQLALGALTFFAIGILLDAIRNGLVLDPDMSIQGVGSSASRLHWYVDRISNESPMVSLISVSFWIWRLLMLAWASWVVVAFLKWIRWGWECFSEGGLWRSEPKKTKSKEGVL